MKNYTIKQVCEISGKPLYALRKQLERDSKKIKSRRKFLGAFKTECCGCWMIPEKYLEALKNLKIDSKKTSLVE